MPEATAASLSPASRGRVVLRAPTRRILSRTLLYVLLVVGGLAMLFPFAWMVSTSFKPDLAVFQTPPQLIPKPFQPSNYSTVVHLFPVWRFLVNSYPGLIVPSIASAYGTFLLRQAFMSLPAELEEAAFVDGAGYWTVFTRIVLPLVRPSLATFGVLSFIASWNSFLWPLVLISSEKLMTLPVGIANLQGEHTTAWNLVMAGTTISVIPIVLVYLIAQKHIVRGFVLSGVKG